MTRGPAVIFARSARPAAEPAGGCYSTASPCSHGFFSSVSTLVTGVDQVHQLLVAPWRPLPEPRVSPHRLIVSELEELLHLLFFEIQGVLGEREVLGDVRDRSVGPRNALELVGNYGLEVSFR